MESEDLAARIAKARSNKETTDMAESGEDPDIPGAMSFGLTAGAQFVAAVAIGGGLGWAADRWLGTKPFGMLGLMVLFFGAAMFNVWRSMSKAVEIATNVAEARLKAAASDHGATDEIDEDR